MTQTEEIRKGVEALFPVGSLVELRIPKSPMGTVIGFFRDQEKLITAIEEYSGKVQAVYYTLNAPDPSLYENAHLKDKANVGIHGCKDAEVTVRNWLLIDCDPIRVENSIPLEDQKVSSTDDEKAASLETAKKIHAYLQELGWASPVRADSGNGYHLLYNLGGITSTPELTTTTLLVLQHLAEKFNTDLVKVDTTVHNPSRITKAYGSLAAKGPNTESRPHRMSCIRTASSGGFVTLAQLQMLKPAVKNTAKVKPGIVIKNNQEKYATTTGPEKMEEFLEYYEIAHKIMSREKKGWKWQIVPCPFNAEHNLGEVAVFVNDDGGYGFKCFHQSCQGNDWQAFKGHLQDTTGKRFFFQTNLKEAIPADAAPTSKMKIVRATSITPEVLNWLWTNRIPFGKLTLFAGHPGIGKGMVTMYLAAMASKGTGWTDCPNTNPPMESIIFSSEDAASDTLVPRLQAAGADLDKVYIVETVTTDAGDRAFSIDKDLPALRRLLEQNPDVKLVIIDPIMNHLGQLKGNSEQELRAGLTPLGRLAQQFGVAMVLVTHFNKNLVADSIQRVGGAMGMVGAVRIAWTFAEDKEDGSRKMLPLKANIAPDTGGLVYKIVSENVEINGQIVSVGKIQWGEATHANVDSALKNDSKNSIAKIDETVSWLMEHLADGNPRLVADIRMSADSMGYKKTVLENAADKIGVIKSTDADGALCWQIKKAE